MHLIRRSAFKALATPSPSFLSKPRSITTASPFLVRSKPQIAVSPIFRRFASNVAEEEETASSADSYGHNSADSLGSADESASSYGSDAYDADVNAAAGGASQGARSDRGNYNRGGREAYPPRGGYASPHRDLGDAGRRPPLELIPTSGIYLGNLTFDTTEEGLKREFSQFGNIRSIRIARDPRGYSKGYAHVDYETVEEAAAAIENKDQTIYQGRRLLVNYTSRSSRSKQPADPTKTLYVGNLAFEMSDADLNNLFKPVDNVVDVRVAIDRRTGQPRGFAHADFVDVASAIKGFEYLKDQVLFGRKLRIDYAESREGWNNTREGQTEDSF